MGARPVATASGGGTARSNRRGALHGDPSDDEARFRALFQRHYNSIFRYALRRVDRTSAQDVVTETFLVAWRRLSDAPEEPLPWLYAIARNVLANEVRTIRRANRVIGRLASGEVGRTQPDPAEQVPTSVAIARAMSRLSEADSEALTLIAWEGLTVRQAATVVGCSPATMSVRLHRARHRLQKHLAVEDLHVASPVRMTAMGPAIT